MKCGVIIRTDPMIACPKIKKRWQIVCNEHWYALPKGLRDWVLSVAPRGKARGRFDGEVSPAYETALHSIFCYLDALAETGEDALPDVDLPEIIPIASVRRPPRVVYGARS